MKKNGFIFIETVIVLVMVALSLALMLASYSLVVRRNEINKFYNRPSEIYALYYLFKMDTTSATGKNYVESGNFWVSASGCNNTPGLASTLGSNCTNAMSALRMVNAGVITNVRDELNNVNVNSKYDNATIEFLNTLQVEKVNPALNDVTDLIPIKYVVGEFFFDNSYYFAAIPISEVVEE